MWYGTTIVPSEPWKSESGTDKRVYIINNEYIRFDLMYTYGNGLIQVEPHPLKEMTIIAVKLELGNTQTLAYQDIKGTWKLYEIPDYQNTYIKCKKKCYFSRYSLVIGRAITNNIIQNCTSIFLDITLDKTCNIRINDCLDNNNLPVPSLENIEIYEVSTNRRIFNTDNDIVLNNPVLYNNNAFSVNVTSESGQFTPNELYYIHVPDYAFIGTAGNI